MDTDFTTTQLRYAEYLERVPDFLSQTLDRVSTDDVAHFDHLTGQARRIILTGVGSSMPAAWYGANTLRNRGMAAQFLPTGALLGMDSLSDDDLVVLSSQGVNRADALLIISKAIEQGAGLVLLTANKDPELRDRTDATYYFEPDQEKLFCRPAGVAANYALMAKLCGDGGDEAMIQAWQAGKISPLELPATKRYIVLSSDDMMPVAWNVALSLREGSGLHTELFDIETYGHGNYVGDLRDRSDKHDFGYILVTGHHGSNSAKSARRILPFVQGVESPYVMISSGLSNAATAGQEILARLARYIYERNQRDTYNMNRPDGKEQNRYYHELASYEA